jgi:hypothetical protein
VIYLNYYGLYILTSSLIIYYTVGLSDWKEDTLD